MSPRCSSTSHYRTDAGAPYNISEVLLQQYKDSPKDDWDRLVKCWGYTDCGDCHRSDGFCGWCAISSTCLPLPTDPLSRAFPLLSPMRYKFICAEGPERFELRTAGLGCQVSTITFLTSIVTIFCTLFGVLVLLFLLKGAKWIGLGLRAMSGGYMVVPNNEGQWKGDIWVRRSETWGRWWRKVNGDQKEFEVEEVDEGTPERARTWWAGGNNGNIASRGAERRPLLEGDLGPDPRPSE